MLLSRIDENEEIGERVLEQDGQHDDKGGEPNATVQPHGEQRNDEPALPFKLCGNISYDETLADSA
jgi:hypothetical protein